MIRGLALAIALVPSAGWAASAGIARLSDAAGCASVLGPAEGDMLAGGSSVGDLGWQLDGASASSSDGHPNFVAWDQASGAFQITNVWGGVYIVPVATTGVRPPSLAPWDDRAQAFAGVLVPTPVPRARRGQRVAGGIDVTWAAVPASSCAVEAASWQGLGWNVYRLPTSAVPPTSATPQQFLGGPDADTATTGDNGFVGYVTYDARRGDGLVHFVDATAAGPADAFTYAVQPVGRLRSSGALPAGYVPDPDGDGIREDDLDRDGDADLIDPVDAQDGFQIGLTMRLDGARTILTAGASSPADVLLFAHRAAGGALRFDWEAMELVSVGHDLYGADLSTVADLAGGDAMDSIACGLPPGPGTTTVTVTDGSAATARFYLMSVNWPEGPTLGADSLGNWRLRAAPCR